MCVWGGGGGNKKKTVMKLDFYKVFWRQLGTFVVRATNSGFQEGELSVTQQHGLISSFFTIPRENTSLFIRKF